MKQMTEVIYIQLELQTKFYVQSGFSFGLFSNVISAKGNDLSFAPGPWDWHCVLGITVSCC